MNTSSWSIRQHNVRIWTLFQRFQSKITFQCTHLLTKARIITLTLSKGKVKLINLLSKATIRHKLPTFSSNADILIWFTNFFFHTSYRCDENNIGERNAGWHGIQQMWEKKRAHAKMYILNERTMRQSIWQCHNRLSPHFVQQMAIYWIQTLIVFNINSAEGKRKKNTTRAHKIIMKNHRNRHHFVSKCRWC